MQRSYLWTIVVFLALLLLGCVNSLEDEQETKEEKPLKVRCPSVASPEEKEAAFCKCVSKDTRSGPTVSIKCDFNHTKNVILTEELYPFRNASLVSVYVRVVNATKVHVTGAFLLELLQSPSIALDVWRAGTLILDSTPVPDNLYTLRSYKTFVGVGIANCFVPDIPKNFLRDRTRGGLRIKSSYVQNFHAGVLHNMEEMRYLVFEDSKVDLMEGSVATEGFVTLSKRQLHSWNGLIISNVTIETISSGAFNLTHKSDMETVSIVNSKIGTISSQALIVTGDMDVSIKDNLFQNIEKEAFQISVSGDIVFDNNTIESWQPDALEGLICHNRTSLERNTFHVDDPTDIALNISTTPFHNSCGTPQLFMVISLQHPLAIVVSTTSSWCLGVLLFVLIILIIVGLLYVHQRQNLVMYYYRSRGRPLMAGLRQRNASQENLPNGAEIDPSAHPPEEGMTNPIYVETS